MKFVTMIFILLTTSMALAKAEIELQTEVEYSTTLGLQLEDMIIPEKTEITALREILNLNVPFHEGTISRTDFLTWLKAYRHERPELRDFSFRIPSEIKITSIKGLSRNQIKQKIQNRLMTKCADCTYQILVSNIPLVTAKNLVLDWKAIPVSGSFMLGLQNAEGQTAGWVSGQIKAAQAVIKTSRVLRSGDTLQESDLAIEPADITFIKDYFVKKSDLIGKKMSRTVSARSLISSADIQRDYDVRQGQNIKAISGNETFEVSIQGVAQESGVVGDLIRIRNLSNQKVMSARIVDKSTVRIE